MNNFLLQETITEFVKQYKSSNIKVPEIDNLILERDILLSDIHSIPWSNSNQQEIIQYKIKKDDLSKKLDTINSKLYNLVNDNNMMSLINNQELIYKIELSKVNNTISKEIVDKESVIDNKICNLPSYNINSIDKHIESVPDYTQQKSEIENLFFEKPVKGDLQKIINVTHVDKHGIDITELEKYSSERNNSSSIYTTSTITKSLPCLSVNKEPVDNKVLKEFINEHTKLDSENESYKLRYLINNVNLI